MSRPCSFQLLEQRCPGQMVETVDGDFVTFTCDRDPEHEMCCHVRRIDPEFRKRMRIEQSGVPTGFLGREFRRDADNEVAVLAVKDWLDDYERCPLPAPALYGHAGRGKSHLLAAACVRLIREKDASVAWFTVRQLLRELQAFKEPQRRDAAWKRATTVDVLALDDLGAMQETDWKHDQLADLVEERYAAERPILLATNYPPAAWERMMDARTFSRLRGMTVPVGLKGRDRRQQEIGAA